MKDLKIEDIKISIVSQKNQKNSILIIKEVNIQVSNYLKMESVYLQDRNLTSIH
jgi:hypothetical protein